MAILWADVNAIAPEMSTVALAHQAAILAYVNGYGINTDAFGGVADEITFIARCYLAAHLAAMAQRTSTGGSGPLISQSEGAVSVKYSPSDGVKGAKMLSETPYGRLFSMLVHRHGASRGPRVI